MLSSVFPWLLILIAMLILYLVLQMEFKEIDTAVTQETFQTPITSPEKVGRGQRVGREIKSENLYKYFDVRKWP